MCGASRQPLTATSRRSPPIVLPRALIFLASLWMIGSWLLAIGLVPPVYPSSSSYEHGLQAMLLCLTTGVIIGWPLLRLSQTSVHAPLRQTLLDLIVMVAMIQVILWPLRLVTTWSPLRTFAIDATLTGWLVLAGAIVAAATGSDRRGPRNLAMLACIGLCLLGPALAYAGVLTGAHFFTLIDLSPVLGIRKLGAGGGAPLTDEQWRFLWVLYTAATAAWAALVGLHWRRSRTPADR